MNTTQEATLGRFRLVRLLGEGGMGQVHLAQDPRTNANVALKILTVHENDHEVITERFRREIHALSTVRHPNLVRIFEAGELDGKLFYTMEHLEGSSLETRIRERGAESVSFSTNLAKHMASALGAVHAAGLVHRDVKPANILFRHDETPVLTDFGLVMARDLSRLTQSNVFVGTYQYSSPEALSGLSTDERSDIYQLGLLLYIILSGHLLPYGERLDEIARNLLAGGIPKLSSIRSDVPTHLEACIARAMDRDPENRHPSMESFQKELQPPPRKKASPQKSNLSSSIDTRIKVEERSNDTSVPLVDRIPWLSPGIVHLLFLTAMVILIGTLFVRHHLTRHPTIPFNQAIGRISADWSALSYHIGSQRRSAHPDMIESLHRRIERTDQLTRELTTVLPEVLTDHSTSLEWLRPLAPKIVHPLRLEFLLRESAIAYESPATDCLTVVLRHLIHSLAQSLDKIESSPGAARSVLSSWHSTLLQHPELRNSLDVSLSYIHLPDTTDLLLICHTIIDVHHKDRESSQLEDRLREIMNYRTDSATDARLAHIFEPLLHGLSPRVWAARTLETQFSS